MSVIPDAVSGGALRSPMAAIRNLELGGLCASSPSGFRVRTVVALRVSTARRNDGGEDS
jgi:hypothetical protein